MKPTKRPSSSKPAEQDPTVVRIDEKPLPREQVERQDDHNTSADGLRGERSSRRSGGGIDIAGPQDR